MFEVRWNIQRPLYCKFPGECDSERILKIGQYLMKLCVDYVGLLFFGPPCIICLDNNAYLSDNVTGVLVSIRQTDDELRAAYGGVVLQCRLQFL